MNVTFTQLAATQSKVLSRRELASVNVATLCSDICNHIPGLRQEGSRVSRFSLYLCCQLMFGSVKVLRKQWDYLLVDVQALCKRCTDVLSSTKDIDIVISRQTVTIDSNLPFDDKDAKLDPYFGLPKEANSDVNFMLSCLESFAESRMLVIEPLPLPVKPEIGSPHSVSDPKEIQIQDVDRTTTIVAELQGEQDLPRMDMESFLSMSHNESLQEIQVQIRNIEAGVEQSNQLLIVEQPIQVQELALEAEERNVTIMREILMDVIPQTEVSFEQHQLLPLEETPLTKPICGIPAPPHKPSHDRPKKPRDPTKKRSRFQDICNDEAQVTAPADHVQTTEKPPTPEALLQAQINNQDEVVADERGHGHDWAQKNPLAVDLHPVSPKSSPLRKKRPHKLVIDEFLMITRPELREHMQNTKDIVKSLELPSASRAKNFYKDPGMNYLKNQTFSGLFTRNLKFGLRQDDTGSEQDSLTSPRLADFQSRKRAKGEDATDTPANKAPRSSETASIEKARASAGLSMSMERNLSQSLVGQANDEHGNITRSSFRSQKSLVSDQETSKDGSILDQDATLNIPVLTPWPEEQEIKVSPIRRPDEMLGQASEKDATLETAVDTAAKTSVPEAQPELMADNRVSSPSLDPAMTTNELDSIPPQSEDTPRTLVYKLVESNVRTKNDWTTFQNICPPTSYTKKTAASMFNALCAQIARGKLRVRQDEPYASIFIWVPDTSSSLSSSLESQT